MVNAHISLPAGSCLISQLLKKLAETSAHSDLNIVLPTQRLCLFLSRELALSAGGATVLPRLWTWDRFVDDVISDTAETKLVMGSSQCELIMEHILETRSASSSRPLHTNTRHAHELVYLGAELARCGDQRGAHQKLLQYLENDWRRSADVYSHLKQRVEDVFAAIEDYDQTLAKLQWTTREAARADAVKAWMTASHEQKLKSLPPGPILIAGLTSLPPAEAKLLGALSLIEGISIWLDEPPSHSESAPLAELRRQVRITSKGPSGVDAWAPGVQQITGCSDITHEVAHVLESVRRLIDSGTPAHEIAVIVPDEDQYGPALTAFAKSIGVPVNMPLAVSWSSSAVGRWLRLVTNLGRGNDIHGFGQFILSPITRMLFDAPEDFNDALFQQNLKHLPAFGVDGQAICDYYARDHQRDGRSSAGSFIQRATQWPFCSADKDILGAKARLFASIDKISRSLPAGAARGESQKSIELLKKAVDQVAQLDVIRKFTPARWTDFLRNIYRTASQETIRETGEPLSGIQIIGLTEARYIPFAKAFIVGCVEGSFPHGLPRDSLVDNQMRRAMGLPGWDELEALEDTTFHLLTSRLPHVELTYAQWNAETPLIRSRWIEMLAPKVDLKILDPASQISSVLCNKDQEPVAKSMDEESELREGIVADAEHLTESTSASRLRNLLWCPYRYLLQARRIEAVELPDDRAHIEAGEWLHKILETFFQKDDLKQLPAALQWRAKPHQSEAFGPWAHDRLDAIARSVVPLELTRTPQFQHMTGRGWQEVAKHWQNLFANGWNPDLVATEVSFGRSSKLSLPIAGRPIEIHGTIDALHSSTDAGPLIIDYKTSTVPAASIVAAGLEPQLPLYAKVLTVHGIAEKPEPVTKDMEEIGLGYFNLSEGKVSFVAVGETSKTDLITKGILSKRNKPASLSGAYRAVEERWANRLNVINTTGQFTADPSDCSLCAYSGICRKDDPRHRDRIANQQIALSKESAAEDDASPAEQEITS